jgi:hypothetical protein
MKPTRAVIRRTAILVTLAMVALALATAGILWSDQRRYDFQRLAFRHQYWLSMTNNSADSQKAHLTAYHRKMLAKYEWAARYPWLPVWPDPPEPKERP